MDVFKERKSSKLVIPRDRQHTTFLNKFPLFTNTLQICHAFFKFI